MKTLRFGMRVTNGRLPGMAGLWLERLGDGHGCGAGENFSKMLVRLVWRRYSSSLSKRSALREVLAVSSVGRASDFDSEGHRFEPCTACQILQKAPGACLGLFALRVRGGRENARCRGRFLLASGGQQGGVTQFLEFFHRLLRFGAVFEWAELDAGDCVGGNSVFLQLAH